MHPCDLHGISEMRRLLTPFLFALTSQTIWGADLQPVRSWDPAGTLVKLTADLDGDGNDELLVASASGQEAIVVGLSDSAAGYRVERPYLPPQTGSGLTDRSLTSARLLDLDLDGVDELCMIWGGTLLTVVERQSGQILRSAVIPAARDLAMGDLDGDGSPELVTLSGSRLWTFDPLTLEQTGSLYLPHPGIGRLFLGDVMGDGREEVILDSGWVLRVSSDGDGWTLEDSVQFSLEHTPYILVTDIDGDGHDEMIAAGLYAGLVVHKFDPVPAQTVLIEPEYLTFVEWVDVNGDARPDAVVALGSTETRAVDLATGATHWSDARHGGDLVAVGSFAPGAAIQLVYAYSTGSLAFETMPPDAEELLRTAPGRVPASVALTGAGKDRKLSILSYEGFLDQWSIPSLHEIDGPMQLQDPVPPSWPLSDEFRDIAGVPGEPDEEAVIVGARVSAESNVAQGKLWFTNSAGQVTRSVSTSGDFVLTSAIVADVLPQAGHEIVANARSYSQGTDRTVVLSIVDGSTLWQSEPVALLWDREPQVFAAALDGSGQLCVAMLTEDRVLVFRPQLDTAPVMTYPDVVSMAILPGASPGDSADLVLHHAHGTLARYEGLSASPSVSVSGVDAGGPVAAFRQAPFQTPLVAVNTLGRLSVLSFDRPEPLFSAPMPVWATRLAAEDIDGDGLIELIAYGGMLQIFEVPGELLFGNGFDIADPR